MFRKPFSPTQYTSHVPIDDLHRIFLNFQIEPLGSILRCGKKKDGGGEREEERRERGKEQKEESNRLCLT